MSKPKFTPKPWNFDGKLITSPNRGKRYQTVAFPGQPIYHSPLSGIDKANGNLIAAAPDLYEALEYVLRDLLKWNCKLGSGKLNDNGTIANHIPFRVSDSDDMGMCIWHINNALAKARGEK